LPQAYGDYHRFAICSMRIRDWITSSWTLKWPGDALRGRQDLTHLIRLNLTNGLAACGLPADRGRQTHARSPSDRFPSPDRAGLHLSRTTWFRVSAFAGQDCCLAARLLPIRMRIAPSRGSITADPVKPGKSPVYSFPRMRAGRT